MRFVKPVLFCIFLSAACIPCVIPQAGTGASGSGAREPGAPLGAGAALVRIIEDGASPRALVRLELLSATGDMEATITRFIDQPGVARGLAGDGPIARAMLAKGRPQTLLIESALEPNRENHLFYRVDGRGRGGEQVDTLVYLRVNLDPALEPEEVGGYLEYMGAADAGVQQ